MSGRGDERLEAALRARLASGPADVLDLLRAERSALGPTLVGHEGAVHALLQRLLRRGALHVAGSSTRDIALYRDAGPAPADTVPRPAPGHDPDPRAVWAARPIRAQADRLRVEADLSAHLAELRAGGAESHLGGLRSLRGLLKRADRGHLAVFLPQGVGGQARRFLLHEGPWIAAAVVLYLILHIFFIKVFVIPSASMLPTLQLGDRVLVRKTRSGWKPERWQVVTYARPGQDGPRTTYVKRVVGLPGEELALWRGDAYINRRLVAKPEALNEVVRARVRAWAFDSAAPPEGWSSARLEAGVDVWNWRGERFWAGPYDAARRFELQDVYLELDVDLGKTGGAELNLSRGREGTERTAFALTVHPHAGLMVQRREPSASVPLASSPRRLTGRVTLKLALVDGVLRASVGDFAWRGSVAVPEEPAGCHFSVQEGARPLALRLDKDLHYGVHGALGVPKDGRAQGCLDCLHKVGAEAIFCLGDNTDDSRDSRFQDVGDIPLGQLIGPVIGRLWPPARIGGVR